jgi:Protein of unknown function (DUF3311)
MSTKCLLTPLVYTTPAEYIPEGPQKGSNPPYPAHILTSHVPVIHNRYMSMKPSPTARRRRRWALLLLVIPFVALLVPGWYAHATPRLSGIPFFIWYQFLWVILGVAITGTVYALSRGGDEEGRP